MIDFICIIWLHQWYAPMAMQLFLQSEIKFDNIFVAHFYKLLQSNCKKKLLKVYLHLVTRAFNISVSFVLDKQKRTLIIEATLNEDGNISIAYKIQQKYRKDNRSVGGVRQRGFRVGQFIPTGKLFFNVLQKNVCNVTLSLNRNPKLFLQIMIVCQK